MTETRLHAEHQEIEKMTFNTLDYAEKLKIMYHARKQQHFIEMSMYNHLTDAKEDINMIGDILMPCL